MKRVIKNYTKNFETNLIAGRTEENPKSIFFLIHTVTKLEDDYMFLMQFFVLYAF